MLMVLKAFGHKYNIRACHELHVICVLHVIVISLQGPSRPLMKTRNIFLGFLSGTDTQLIACGCE